LVNTAISCVFVI